MKNLKNRILSIVFLAGVMFFAFTGTACADNGITVDGKGVSDSYLKDGRLMVQLRSLAEAMEMEVEYDPQSQIIKGQRGFVVVELDPVHSTISVNGRGEQLEVTPENKEGRIYVPVRSFVEAFGAKVDIIDGDVMISTKVKDSNTKVLSRAFTAVTMNESIDQVCMKVNGVCVPDGGEFNLQNLVCVPADCPVARTIIQLANNCNLKQTGPCSFVNTTGKAIRIDRLDSVGSVKLALVEV